MPPPARRPLVAQQFRSRALSVLPPEKPESFAFWPPEAAAGVNVLKALLNNRE
jgi:hypothetical protein